MLRLFDLLVLHLLVTATSCEAAGLLVYIAKEDSSFKWQETSRSTSVVGRTYILDMTSQTWQGNKWTHEIEILKPVNCEYPKTAILFITGGKPGGGESIAAALLAKSAGCPVAVLYGIPNQPLFDDLREDALIAHTFVKALETDDPTWPLLLPMTKAAVRAMDAVQAFSEAEFGDRITGFVVSGASKRGWTTWLTAAADPVRVKGIIPLVYDNLNIAAQMPHQIECWGNYSDKIDD